MLTGEYIAFPEFDIATAAVSVSEGIPACLHPAERGAIGNAAPRRIREFAAGRQAARIALASLGLGQAAICRSPDRRPIWPGGVVGSISHSQTFAAAAVSRDAQLAGLGFDLEQPIVDGVETVAPAVLTMNEFDTVQSTCAGKVGFHVARVLSCKEAVYKAVYPLVGEYFDFLDIRIEFDTADDTFTAKAVSRLASAALFEAGRGRCKTLSGQIVSMFVIEAEEATSLRNRTLLSAAVLEHRPIAGPGALGHEGWI